VSNPSQRSDDDYDGVGGDVSVYGPTALLLDLGRFLVS
jgi:hypothetical protein